MRLSKSKVNSYRKCPQMYQWQYINKLPYSNKHMKKGKEIHEIVDKFFDIATSKSDFIEVLKGLAGERWEDYQVELTKFAIMEDKRRDSPYFKPLFREIKIVNKQFNFSGIVDRIDYDDELGELVLWDYKTGTVTPKSFNDMRFELCLYAYMIYIQTNRFISHVGVRALKTGREFMRKVTPKDSSQALLLLLDVREEIKKSTFERKEGNYCFWCPYKEQCKKMIAQEKQATLEKIGDKIKNYQ